MRRSIRRANKIPLINRIRGIKENISWIFDIQNRDNAVCQCCKLQYGPLHIHHIVPLQQIIDEENIKTLEDAICNKRLWDRNNGEILCVSCHISLHKKGKNKCKEE